MRSWRIKALEDLSIYNNSRHEQAPKAICDNLGTQSIINRYEREIFQADMQGMNKIITHMVTVSKEDSASS